MALPDVDTSLGHSFGLELDGVAIKAVTEISGLSIEVESGTTRSEPSEGTSGRTSLPGRPKGGEVTITRPVTADTALQDWVKSARAGKVLDARRGGSIVIYDYEGTPVRRLKLDAAWPKRLEFEALKAGDTTVILEKLVLGYEALEPE